MANKDGPVINENTNKNPNQNPNQAQGNVQDDDQAQNLPPHNPKPQRPQLNWSHFKPKYGGKLEEDAQAHLPRMNDWMDTHDF